MNRLSRSLANRLRRAAFPAPRPTIPAAPSDVWGRLERALSSPVSPDHVTQRREMAEENVRLAITLIGQQGRSALARVLASFDGEMEQASEAARIALALARAAGHTP